MKKRPSWNFLNVTLVSFCNRYRHFAFNSALSTVRPAGSNLQEGLKIYAKDEKNLIPSYVSISNSIVKKIYIFLGWAHFRNGKNFPVKVKRPWCACVRNLTGAIYIYPGFSENHCHCDAWNMAVEGENRIVAFSHEVKNPICQEENLKYL